MKTALITGASSGIGKEFAYLLGEDGYNLVLVARGVEAMEEIASDCSRQFGISTTVIEKDLSIEGCGIELFNEINSRGLIIDVLINNAGFGDNLPFVASELVRDMNMIRLNIGALTELTHIYANEMQQRNQGMILNVASTAAFQPIPTFAVYAATKAFVLHLTEALHYELKNTGVKISALCPGPTATGFEKNANMQESKLFNSAVMDAKKVAIIGYKGLNKGKMTIIPGFKNKFLAFITNMTPFRKLVVNIAGRMV